MSRSRSFGRFVLGRLAGRGLACKVAVCLVAVAAIEVALAQAPPAGGGPANAAPAAKDDRGYKVLNPNKTMSTDRVLRNKIAGEVRAILMGENGASDYKRFDAYYSLYYFPTMTQTTDEALQALPEERQRFLRNDLENCRNQETQTRLTNLAFDEMLAIARDPEFHPAVRYNALLLVGSLNDREAVRIGTPSLPVPMGRALPVLLEEFRRAENSDALKVAALIGLSRHLEWDAYRTGGGIPAPQKAEVLGELTTLAQAKEPPAGRSPAGHAWFRRRAIEALGLAGVVKADPAVVAAFGDLLKDPAETLAIRATVAAALGKLKIEAPAKVDAAATAKELGYLALVACDSELNRISDLRKTDLDRAARLAKAVNTFSGAALSSGAAGGMEGMGAVTDDLGGRPEMGGMPAMPGMAGGGGSQANLLDPKAYHFDFVRRRIRYHLYCVQLGLNGGQEKSPTAGVAAVAKAGPELEGIAAISGDVRKLIEIVEVKAVDLAQLEKDLRRAMKPLETKTRKLAPPVPAATPAAAPASDAPAGDLPAAAAPARPAAAAADADAPAAVAPAAVAPAAVAPAGDADAPAAVVPAADAAPPAAAEIPPAAAPAVP